MSQYRCLFAVVVVLSTVFYGGCGRDSIDAYDQDGATQTASSAGVLAVLDETIPESHAEAYEELHEDINAITEAAEVIFIGRVVDYKQRLYMVPPSADMLAVAEPDWEIVDVYEGIVLEADEVLLGEMPEAGSRITLGVRALQETLDGASRSRNVNREIALFHDGIKSMGSDDAPRYLVYAGPSGSGGRAHAFGLYWIRTRAGVVRVNDDGSLGRGGGMPFATVWDVNEAGEYEWVLPYVLQDARDAAELAKGGIEDTTGPPEEQTPGLEEDPTEQSDDNSEKVDPGDGGTPGTDEADVGDDTDTGDGAGDGADTGDDADTDTGDDTDAGDVGTGDSGDLGDTQDGDGGDRVPDAGDPSDAESSDVDSGSPDAKDQVGQENGGFDAESPGG